MMPGRRLRAVLGTVLLLAVSLAGLPAPAAAHGGSEVFGVSGAVYVVTWSADGTMFAAATDTGNITIYDGVSHVLFAMWHAHDGPINEVAFSPDGRRIASASGAYKVATVERNVKVWDITTPTPTLQLTMGGLYDWGVSVAWSPDGSMIAASSGVDDHQNRSQAYGEVLFWNSTTGVVVWNASPLDSYPARISWAPDGHALAAVGHLNDVWLLEPPRPGAPATRALINHSFFDIVGHASHGWAAAWSPDSRFLLGGFSVDFDHDGRTDLGLVLVFDPSDRDADGYARQVMRGEIHGRPAEWVGWDSSGRFVASCSGTDLFDMSGSTPRPGTDNIVDTGELVIYNFTKSIGKRTLIGENVFLFGRSWCSSLAWRPGNLTVAAGNADGTVKLYVLDEDGDGCMLWVDSAPLDPNECEAATPYTPTFLESWGLPLLGVGAVAVAVGGFLLVRRSRVDVEPHRNGRGRGAPRTGRDRPPPRRR